MVDMVDGAVMVSSVSVNGRHRYAFPMKTGDGKEFVMVDGKEGPVFDEVRITSPFFSFPNGRHFAYVARTGDEWTIVVDGNKDGPRYEYILNKYVFIVEASDGCYIQYTVEGNDDSYPRDVWEYAGPYHRCLTKEGCFLRAKLSWEIAKVKKGVR